MLEDRTSILRTPKEHFVRATELRARWELLNIRAKEIAIRDKGAAAILMLSAETDRTAAIWHLAKGLEALALAKQINIIS